MPGGPGSIRSKASRSRGADADARDDRQLQEGRGGFGSKIRPHARDRPGRSGAVAAPSSSFSANLASGHRHHPFRRRSLFPCRPRPFQSRLVPSRPFSQQTCRAGRHGPSLFRRRRSRRLGSSAARRRSPEVEARSGCRNLLDAARTARASPRNAHETILREGSMSVLAELLEFLGTRKKFWLIPLLALFLLFGGLFVLSQGSVVAPFIYTLFCTATNARP